MMWIARDFDGGLYTFINKPWLQTVDKIWLDYPIYIDWKDDNSYYEQLDCNLYPEITFENSPQQVELKLKSMNKTTKYAWYNTIGLQEILKDIDEITAEYDKRVNFFKTIKTNTIYCEKTDYPRLFHIKTIDWDKLRFKGTSVTLADNAIYEKTDSFPLDFLLKCEELVDFQDTYNKMVEEIKSIEKRKEMNYKLFSKLIKENKKL